MDFNSYFFRKILKGYLHCRILFFKKLVKKQLFQAFKNKKSYEYKKIHSSSLIFYGLNKNGNYWKEKKFRDVIWKSMCELFNEEVFFDLGLCDIGFEDIKIVANSKSVCEAWTYLQGFYDELTVLNLYPEIIKKGDLVIDIGSNIGIYSLVLSKIVGNSGLCLAYEPNHFARERFYENIKLNKVNHIKIIPKALGNIEGDIPFNFEETNFNQGVGHFDKESKNTVKVSKLDKEMEINTQQISLIKIDVEGYELEIIKGGKFWISKTKPYIIIEYNSPSWTLDDIKKEISYPFNTIRIPNNYWEKPSLIKNDSELTGFNNLLLVPFDKKVPKSLEMNND